MVQVGFGGHKNLETHQQSKSCKQKIWATKQVALLDSFFRPAAPKNPPTIRALPKVHAEPSSLTPPDTPVSHDEVDNEGCRIARTLLKKLKVTVQRIPETAPLADNTNLLAVFSGDPDACVLPDVDCWEDVVNPMMKVTFGWGNKSQDSHWTGQVCNTLLCPTGSDRNQLEPVGFRSVPSWSLISNWFPTGSDWFPTGFRLVSDWF